MFLYVSEKHLSVHSESQFHCNQIHILWPILICLYFQPILTDATNTITSRSQSLIFIIQPDIDDILKSAEFTTPHLIYNKKKKSSLQDIYAHDV